MWFFEFATFIRSLVVAPPLGEANVCWTAPHEHVYQQSMISGVGITSCTYAGIQSTLVGEISGVPPADVVTNRIAGNGLHAQHGEPGFQAGRAASQSNA